MKYEDYLSWITPNEYDLMNNDYDITYAANIFFQIICKHPIVYF